MSGTRLGPGRENSGSMTRFSIEDRVVVSDGGRARVRVAADCDWFDGHFDGAPVLPGVAHLALADALGAFDAHALASVSAARMRVPIAPGDDVVAEWTRSGDAVEFRLARGGRPASAFSVVVGPRAAAAVDDPREPPARNRSIELDHLLPHRRRARLIESIVQHDAERLVAVARAAPEHPFARDRRVPSCLALELAAQAAAAHGALGAARDRSEPTAPRGFLVGARDVDFPLPSFACGDPLEVTVTRAGAAPPLRVYRFSIGRREGAIASGEISVYVETD